MDFDERLEPTRTGKQGWNRTAANARQSGGSGCGKLSLALVIAAFIVLPFTPFGKRQLQETFRPPPQVKIEERVVEKRVEIPPPLPDKFVPSKQVNVADLFNGLRLKNEMDLEPGGFASMERLNPDSYAISFKVEIKVPKPNTTLEELSALNPELPKMLTDFPTLVKSAKVSGFFHHIYQVKQQSIKIDLSRLDKVLSRHNYYDLETVLELQHPSTKQRALLIQGEMDVVSDGSDGDRMPTFDDYIAKSQFFQPTTSYFWSKTTAKPNPLLARYEAKLADAKEKAKGGNKEAKGNAEYMGRYVEDLKKKSFLIAQEDPFIVIPLSMKSYQGLNDYAPSLGDYVAVICDNQILPAIIGDYGPKEKMGEASLRIAKQLNAKANSNSRPVSDLTVSYLIFPGSADKPSRQPNLAKWTERCQELLDAMGGIGAGYSLFKWDDHFNGTPAAAAPAPATPEAAPATTTPPTPKTP